MRPPPTRCPDCAGTALAWDQRTEGGEFWIGCTECSMTVATYPPDEVLQLLNNLLDVRHILNQLLPRHD